MNPFEREVWDSTADFLDPAGARRRKIKPEDEAALATPVTLAHHLQRSYKLRAHLTVIGDAYARMEKGEIDRLVLNTPPQVGKTVTAVVWAAFWYLILHPTHRVIIVCYGDSLAVKRGLSTRRLVEEFGARYGLALDPASQAAHNWSLTTGGGIRSVGIGSGITGEPGDFVIIDDAHKNREEAESPTFREKVHDAYSADILTRLAPKAPLAIVMTRWHPDDLAGRVMAQEGIRSKGGRWELLHMPAIATEPDDPLGRSIGDPLPHPKIQEHDRAGALAHWENARATNVPRDWFSMYQADPRPVEGAMVSGDILRQRRCYEFGTERPCAEGVTHAVAIDPSGGGRDTAGVVAGYLGDDERLYVTHDWSARMKSEDWSRKACELAVLTKADRFIIEKNYGGDLCQLAVRTAWVQLAAEEQEARAVARAEGRDPGPVLYGPLIPRVVEVTARKNKILRAEPIAQQIIMDRMRFAAYLPGIEHQWQTFLPTSKESPGNLDACVYLGYDLLPMPASGETQFQESPDMVVDLTRALSPSDGMMGGYGGVGDWR